MEKSKDRGATNKRSVTRRRVCTPGGDRQAKRALKSPRSLTPPKLRPDGFTLVWVSLWESWKVWKLFATSRNTHEPIKCW